MATLTPSRAEELLATGGSGRVDRAWAKLTQRLRATAARRARLAPVRESEDDGA